MARHYRCKLLHKQRLSRVFPAGRNENNKNPLLNCPSLATEELIPRGGTMRNPGLSPNIAAYRLRFSGSGGEYFRVWFVNLLMLVLTAGLFTPWARWRNARYFYDHTLVAQSPLEFKGSLRRMVISFFLFSLLYLAYEIAQYTGQETAVLLFVIGGAVLAPYIWGSAIRFRLGSTHWRGLQLHFAATWKDVYRASWPIFAMAAIWLAIDQGLTMLATTLPTPAPRNAPPNPFAFNISPSMGALIITGVILSLLCLIRVDFNYKSLLVLRAGIGQQTGRWKPVYADFVRIWLQSLLVFVLMVALLIGVGVGLTYALKGHFRAPVGMGMYWIFLGVLVISALSLMIAFTPAWAYREARMFRLIWSNVGLSQVARFKCDLKPWAFVRLRLLNLFLTILTLGFYRPFARVQEYRMKADSVTIHIKGGMDQLIGELVRQQGSLGDILADAIGLDIVN
jgi:uncharacterized membrane protein YjgN (DUF898 family)